MELSEVLRNVGLWGQAVTVDDVEEFFGADQCVGGELFEFTGDISLAIKLGQTCKNSFGRCSRMQWKC